MKWRSKKCNQLSASTKFQPIIIDVLKNFNAIVNIVMQLIKYTNILWNYSRKNICGICSKFLDQSIKKQKKKKIVFTSYL